MILGEVTVLEEEQSVSLPTGLQGLMVGVYLGEGESTGRPAEHHRSCDDNRGCDNSSNLTLTNELQL